jgi:hypothetical protein
MLGPVMSASSSPTLAPAFARATARLTDTVLLPTPPLPDATAITFLTPGTSCSGVRGAARRTVADHSTASDSTPSGVSAWRMSPSIWSLRGQAGVVSSTVNATFPPSMARSRIMFRVTRSPPSSGSWTVRRAARTSASEIAIMGAGQLLRRIGPPGFLMHGPSISYPRARPRAAGGLGSASSPDSDLRIGGCGGREACEIRTVPAVPPHLSQI